MIGCLRLRRGRLKICGLVGDYHDLSRQGRDSQHDGGIRSFLANSVSLGSVWRRWFMAAVMEVSEAEGGTCLGRPGLPDRRSAGPGLPDRRSAGPGAPDYRSECPGTPDRRSECPGTPERRSECPVTPERRSECPGTPERRSECPGAPERRSAGPVAPDRR
ncbi:hypothetical protein M0R45_007648 [Rubus argutus]|uniref:Uncharacterized protein n=1 Tax=Rubus argutus TaxID=59490 RepID=A0AAW1XZN3_RUBAR